MGRLAAPVSTPSSSGGSLSSCCQQRLSAVTAVAEATARAPLHHKVVTVFTVSAQDLDYDQV